MYSVFYFKNVEFQTWSAHCILLPKLSKNEPVCIHIHSIHSLLYQQIKAGKQNIKVTISFDQALEIGFIGSPHLLIRYIWMDFIRAPLGNFRHLREMRWFLSISVQFFFFNNNCPFPFTMIGSYVSDLTYLSKSLSVQLLKFGDSILGKVASLRLPGHSGCANLASIVMEIRGNPLVFSYPSTFNIIPSRSSSIESR